MLEDFFIVPAAAQRLRSCSLGVHLDAFCARLSDLGYRRPTIRDKLGVVADLTRWMAEEHLAVVDLDERRVDQFLDARRRRGRTCRGFRPTVLLLLEQMRSAGVMPTPVPAGDDSPMATLLTRYEGYLRRERALAESTIAGYLPFVRALVAERLDGGAACPTARAPAMCATSSSPAFGAWHRSARSTWPPPCARSCDSCSCAARIGRTSPSPSRRYASGDLRACPAISPHARWNGSCAPARVRRPRDAETARSSCSSLDWDCARAR